ncbi:hypothetical protein [Rhodohalobacter sp. 614A]|uniref:hypothetical protein n=1 Tax=Rhodohalobacter sp. 614A TaxID=2908649 RepID=UPI001F31BDA9|nr:hypothetical protein [Rhodohalobacter sp. 614A]
MNCAFIQGFSPVFPILAIVLLALVSFFLAWWSYQHLSSVPQLKRYTLITLRAASLFILLLLLLNPFFVRQNSDSDNPRIAVFIDNSQSLSVERGEYSGLESYSNIIAQFRSSESSEFEYDYFLFDDEVSSFDEVTVDGFRTNLNSLIEFIRERETNYRASVIFSDGILTNGRNPVFAAQNLSIPLITVPVGDTTAVRDIAISNVDFIQTVYTQTRQTFTAEIQQQGFEGEETTVQLFKDGELTETHSLTFSAETSSQIVEFQQEFTEAGFFDFEIRIPPKDGEFTEQNNQSQFTIEVLEDKTNILSLAFEIHPDIGSIRRLIATDQQNELFSSTYLGNNRFVGSNPQQLNEDMDLIVLHGLPAINSSLFEWLNNQQVPILYIAAPNTFRILMSNQITQLTASYLSSIGNQQIDVQLEPFQSSVSHPVLELQSAGIQRFPTLQTYRGQYQSSSLSQTLLTANYRSIQSGLPVLIVEDASTSRRASVTAYGWYRFEQSQNPETRQFFEQLFTNLISWTSTSPDRENLIIEPAKSIFSENEPVEIRGTLFNERGEPEPDAIIELDVNYEDRDEESSVYRMTHRQNESYSADIGNYPQGIYRVEATATKNNRTIGTAETRVRVSQSSAEFLNTKRNDELLRRLSEFTEGIFLQDYDMNRLNDFLQDSESVQISEEISEELVFIHHSAIWFFVVLFLLSVEWILRRSVSLP